jgi:hypothetical protein
MGKHEAVGGQQEQELSPAAQILEKHGLGHFLEVTISDPHHPGQTTTVSDALACGPFADAITGMDAALQPEQFGATIQDFIGGMTPPAEGAA